METRIVYPQKKKRIKPEELEQKSLGLEAYRERFDFCRFEKIFKEYSRFTRYEQKIYDRKKLKLRSLLGVGAFILSGRLKKKHSPGKLHKNCVEERPYFNKQKVFSITY